MPDDENQKKINQTPDQDGFPDEAFTKAFDEFTIELPMLRKRLVELENIQPKSTEEFQFKENESKKTQKRIDEILTGHNLDADSTELTNRDYVFRENKSGTWSLVFAGERCPPLPHRKGFKYIHYLLQQPGKELSALKFISIVDSPAVSDSPQTGIPPDLNEQDAFSGQDSAPDEKALAQYKEKYAELKEKLDEANELQAYETVEKIRIAMEQLEEEIRHAQAARKRHRRNQPEEGSHAKKAQDTIRTNIKNAIELIAQSAPELAAHLEKHLKRGAINVYKPDNKIPWTLK